MVHLNITCFGVDDNVKLCIIPVLSAQHTAEYILKYAHHGGAVNVLKLLKLGETVYQVNP
jgi:hypothetical protein